jgi:predicted GIY-YIG superfamily endonuclease
LKRHNNGLEKFSAPYAPWVIRCVIEKSTRSEAMILEKKLKNLNKKKLLKFIEKYSSVAGPTPSLGIRTPFAAHFFGVDLIVGI